MSEPELFEIDAALIRYCWSKNAPYTYLICTEDELEQYQNSNDEIDYCSQEIINLYEDYRESFEVVAKKTFKFSEGIENIFKKYHSQTSLQLPTDVVYRNTQ